MPEPDEREVDVDEARKMTASGACRLVWMGREPLDYVAELIGFDLSRMAQIDPDGIRTTDAQALKSMAGAVFMCYHGVTSMGAVRFLDGRGVRAYSLKGGITSIVGEIF